MFVISLGRCPTNWTLGLAAIRVAVVVQIFATLETGIINTTFKRKVGAGITVNMLRCPETSLVLGWMAVPHSIAVNRAEHEGN